MKFQLLASCLFWHVNFLEKTHSAFINLTKASDTLFCTIFEQPLRRFAASSWSMGDRSVLELVCAMSKSIYIAAKYVAVTPNVLPKRRARIWYYTTSASS